MRDIIWTLILVWLVYKVVDIFRLSTSKRAAGNADRYSQSQQNTAETHTAPRNEKDIKGAVKKHLNNEGEYVDFEEIK
jgi:uncharacterized protein DUF4834